MKTTHLLAIIVLVTIFSSFALTSQSSAADLGGEDQYAASYEVRKEQIIDYLKKSIDQYQTKLNCVTQSTDEKSRNSCRGDRLKEQQGK